jgi:hypothetical protein
MNHLELTFSEKRLFFPDREKKVALDFAEKWDELTKDELLYIIYLNFQEQMPMETKKTLLLKKLTKIKTGLFSMLNAVQIISIYDCLDVFFEEPKLTKNLLQQTTHRQGLTRKKLIGPGDCFGNLTVSEFISAEDHYFEYLTDGYEMSALNMLVATLWREPIKGLTVSSIKYNGDLREAFNSHHVAQRLKIVERMPDLWKVGMLYYYQGCRSLLSDLYEDLFEPGNDDGAQNADAWLEMLGHLPNDKFGTIDEIGPMNLLTVLYFTNLTIAKNKKLSKSVV